MAKLVSAKTGDTLCDASRVVKLPAATFPLPSLFMAVTVAKKGDEGKISSALARLMEEEATARGEAPPKRARRKDQRLHDLMIELAPLQVSTLYLFREQTYRGRCLVAYRAHVNELYELPPDELPPLYPEPEVPPPLEDTPGEGWPPPV